MDSVIPHLVISDDDRDLRNSLGGLYTDRGFRTSLAADGIEALEIATQVGVHLLLLDWHMPRMSGWDVYRQLRRQKSQLPCILMSGADASEVLGNTTDDAYFTFMHKPLNPRRLMEVTWASLHRAYNWPVPPEVLAR